MLFSMSSSTFKSVFYHICTSGVRRFFYILRHSYEYFINTRNSRFFSAIYANKMVKLPLLLSFLGLVAFGFVHGSLAKENIGTFELKKGNFSVKFTNWGATIVSVIVPDKNGNFSFLVWSIF